MKSFLSFILLISISVLMAGCKLAVIIVEGGEVQSTGSRTCLEGTVCVHQVKDTNFSEKFTAVPNDGWYFHKWNSGDRFFCAESTEPRCTLSFQGLEESNAVEDMVASSETFYLMPIFKPYQDIIAVDGKEWLQPDLFTNLSWNDINAVCPEGACTGDLNGHDMTGWTWASDEDMWELFNYYIGADVLGPAFNFYTSSWDAPWATAFSSDGWHPTDVTVSFGAWAWRGYIAHDPKYPRGVYDSRNPIPECHAGTAWPLCDAVGLWHYSGLIDASASPIGAWFNRSPPKSQ